MPRLHCWMRGVFAKGSMVNMKGTYVVNEVDSNTWSMTEKLLVRSSFEARGALRAKSNQGFATGGEWKIPAPPRMTGLLLPQPGDQANPKRGAQLVLSVKPNARPNRLSR